MHARAHNPRIHIDVVLWWRHYLLCYSGISRLAHTQRHTNTQLVIGWRCESAPKWDELLNKCCHRPTERKIGDRKHQLTALVT